MNDVVLGQMFGAYGAAIEDVAMLTLKLSKKIKKVNRRSIIFTAATVYVTTVIFGILQEQSERIDSLEKEIKELKKQKGE